MTQAIFSWLYGVGKTIGADLFYKAIGPYGTLALALVIGLLFVFGWAFIYNKTLTNYDIHVGLKIPLAIIEFAIFSFLMYLFVVGNIGLITRLGGL